MIGHLRWFHMLTVVLLSLQHTDFKRIFSFLKTVLLDIVYLVDQLFFSLHQISHVTFSSIHSFLLMRNQVWIILRILLHDLLFSCYFLDFLFAFGIGQFDNHSSRYESTWVSPISSPVCFLDMRINAFIKIEKFSVIIQIPCSLFFLLLGLPLDVWLYV